MLALTVAMLLQASPTADMLMSQYAARAAQTSAVGARLQYTKIHTEYDVADPVNPRRLEKREIRVRTVNKRTLETIIAINDGPVINSEPSPGELSLDAAFLARFRYELIRAEPEVCPGCYLLSFEPREKQADRRSMAEEIISRTGGTLLVDVNDGAILWLKGELRKPFRKFVFGKVREAEVQMSQEVVFGTAMTVSARIRVTYSKFFSDYHRLIELSFFGFELEPETPSP